MDDSFFSKYPDPSSPVPCAKVFLSVVYRSGLSDGEGCD